MVPRDTRNYGCQAWFPSLVLVIVTLTLTTGISVAEPPPSSAASPSIENLTQGLMALNVRYHLTDPSAKASLLTNLLTVAAARKQLLDALIEDNPSEILTFALPDSMRAEMPPEVRAYIEQRLELEGTLGVLHVDYKDPSQSRYLHLLETISGERYSLHFATHPPELLSGARVRVRGFVLYGVQAKDAGETEGAMVLEDENTGLQILEAGGSGNTTTTSSSSTTSVLPNTLGAQKTLVILVNFQDNPTQPYTAAYVQNVVFGTASNFFLENSYQQTWLSGDVVGWYTIALSSTVCDPNTLATQAQSAASAAGVNLSGYSHLVYAFPQNACGGRGFATLGGNQVWINGSLDLYVVGHEMGHNFGLYHSHSLECGTAVLGTNCTVMEYGDPFDTMANTNPGHFSAFQKERLGWLNAGASPPITTVLSDGTYTLDTYEPTGFGPKALKILKSTDPSTGQRTWYYVESRQAISFDGFLASNANVLNGVLVHLGTEGNADSSYLLDMTPGSGSLNYLDWLDPAIVVAQTFDDPDTGLTITTDSVTGTGAAVTVRFGAGGTTPNQLTVAVSTNQASYTRGQTVYVSALVSSGGSPVANATVSFTVTKPNGAVVTATATTGTNGTAVYQLRLRKQDPVGTYQVSAVATINGLSSSAVTTFTVK